MALGSGLGRKRTHPTRCVAYRVNYSKAVAADSFTAVSAHSCAVTADSSTANSNLLKSRHTPTCLPGECIEQNKEFLKIRVCTLASR